MFTVVYRSRCLITQPGLQWYLSKRTKATTERKPLCNVPIVSQLQIQSDDVWGTEIYIGRDLRVTFCMIYGSRGPSRCRQGVTVQINHTLHSCEERQQVRKMHRHTEKKMNAGPHLKDRRRKKKQQKKEISLGCLDVICRYLRHFAICEKGVLASCPIVFVALRYHTNATTVLN